MRAKHKCVKWTEENQAIFATLWNAAKTRTDAGKAIQNSGIFAGIQKNRKYWDTTAHFLKSKGVELKEFANKYPNEMLIEFQRVWNSSTSHAEVMDKMLLSEYKDEISNHTHFDKVYQISDKRCKNGRRSRHGRRDITDCMKQACESVGLHLKSMSSERSTKKIANEANIISIWNECTSFSEAFSRVTSVENKTKSILINTKSKDSVQSMISRMRKRGFVLKLFGRG